MPPVVPCGTSDVLTQRLANIVFAIILIVACAYFAVVAQGFEAAGLLATSGLPSRFFPQLILAFTALCAAVVAYRYAVRGSAGDDEGRTVFGDAGEARRGLLMLAVAVVCYVVWSRFGFVPMAVLMGPLSLLAMGVRSVRIYVAVLVLTGLVYGVFTRLLGVQLA